MYVSNSFAHDWGVFFLIEGGGEGSSAFVYWMECFGWRCIGAGYFYSMDLRSLFPLLGNKLDA